MIAEIHGKISSTGSNLTERLEDKLTGDVFGRLRYIPFHQAMKDILLNVDFKDGEIKKQFHEVLKTINSLNYNFWPKYKIAELDLILDNQDKNLIIGIEVKYNSGLSQGNREEDPDQLIRESGELTEKRIGPETYFIFLAKKVQAVQVYNEYYRKIPKNVRFGYLSWENVLISLQKVIDNPQNKEYPYDIILTDLINLLKRKGFESFKNFYKGIEKVDINKEYFHYK